MLSQSLRVNDYARFSGTASDPDGDPLQVTFAVVSGHPISLDVTSLKGQGSVFFVNSFVVPQGTVGQTIRVDAIVSDGKNDPVKTTFSFYVSGVNTPPQVTAVLADSRGHSLQNPLPSPGSIPFALSIASDDGYETYSYSWGVVRLSGSICDAEGLKVSGASAETGWVQIGRMSTNAIFQVTLTVKDQSLTATDSFFAYVEKSPGGCTPSAVPSANLKTSLINDTASPGQRFTATMTGTSPDPITFLLKASTTNLKASAPVVVNTTRSNCSGGCTETTSLFAPKNGDYYYLWLSVSSTAGTSSLKRTITVGEANGGGNGGGGGPVPCEERTIRIQSDPDNSVFEISPTEKDAAQAGGDLRVEWSCYGNACGDEYFTDLTIAEFFAKYGCETSVTQPEADLEIVLPSQQNGTIDQAFSYSVTVTNKGPDTASSVQLTHPIPPGFNVVEARSGSNLCAQSGSQVTCEIGDLAEGQTRQASFEVRPALSGSFQAQLSAQSATTDDPIQGNNTASLSYEIATSPVQNLDYLVFPRSMGSSTSNSGNEFIGVAVTNTSEVSGDVQFRGLSLAGEETEQASLSDLEDRALAGKQQLARTTEEIVSSPNTVVVTAQPTAGELKGFFLVGSSNLTVLDGVAASPTGFGTQFFPLIQASTVTDTRFFVFNPTDGTVEVGLELLNSNGETFGTQNLTIAAQGSTVQSTKDLFNVVPFDGYMRLTSEAPLLGFELLSNGQGFGALRGLAPLETNRLFAPHAVASSQDSAQLRLLNAGSESIRAVVQVFDSLGNPAGTAQAEIKPGELFRREVAQIVQLDPGQLFTGYLMVDLTPVDETSTLTPKALGSMTFQTKGGQTVAALPLLVEGRNLNRFFHAAQSYDWGIFTGLAILNLEDEAAAVTIRLYNPSGEVVAEIAKEIQPGHKIAQLLSEILEEPEIEALGGHFEVESDRPVVCFALFGDMTQQYLAAIEAQ